MGRLFELRITQLPPEDGAIPFNVRLLEITHHPPHYDIAGGLLVDTSPWSQLTADRVMIPASDLSATASGSLPPDLISQVQNTAAMAGWLANPDPPRPWGGLDWAAARLVVEAEPRHAPLQWEQLTMQRVAVIRRIRGPAPVIERHLDSRIEIAFEAADRQPVPPIDRLLDGFVLHAAAESGSVAWNRPPEDSDIWHLTLTSAQEAIDRLRQSPGGPRVVVLQLTGAPPDPAETGAVLEAAFGGGAWAVVIALLPEEQTSTFFHPFYRKILHNWPLEFCIWGALEESAAGGYPVRLYALPGGELAISLSRIPPELALTPLSRMAERGALAPAQAMTGSAPPETPPPAPPPARRRPRAKARPRTGRPPGASATAMPGLRRDRVVSDLSRRLEATAGAVFAEHFEPAIRHVDSLPFDAETHDLQEVTEVAASIRSAVAAEAPLVAEIAASPPGPRHTNVRLFDPAGARHSIDQPFSPANEYTLEVAIEASAEGAHVTQVFDESSLAEEFKKRETIDLEVVIFSPGTEFEVPENRATLALPRVGDSPPVAFRVTPRHRGWCALRVAIYYHNTMLQSLAVRVYAGPSETMPAGAVPTIRQDLDWAATTDLQLLDDLPRPMINIFANDAPDGSHWIGIFSQEPNALKLRSGDMWKLDAQDLTARVGSVRDKMQACHGTDRYLYPDGKPPSDPEVAAFGTGALVDLAVIGRLAYESLIDLSEGTTEARLEAFDDALRAVDDKAPGIISIARCDSKWSAPWAVMYDKHLDIDDRGKLKVCPLAESQITSNRWTGDKLTKKVDLLDSPRKCREQPGCPLSDPALKATTVCPLGFWGFRYQIEQPLQQVGKVATDQVPGELAAEAFNQSSSILRPKRQKVRVGAGVFPFPRVEAHRSELEAIKGVQVEWESERPKVLNLMYQPKGHHLLYFYCHGRELDGVSFALQVGPKDDPANTISPTSIDRDLVQWGGKNPQPLVVVIACESLAARPELAHDLFAKLRRIKASGVLGAEISIGVRLGREVGEQVMRSLAGGVSVGETMLKMRLDMLRRFNPLGLALTANAPATLHLCDDPAGNGSCKRYHSTRST